MNTKKNATKMFILGVIVKTLVMAIPMSLIGMLIATIGWSIMAVGAIAIVLACYAMGIYFDDFEEYKTAIESVDTREGA